MLRFTILFFVALSLRADTTITLLQFSDYHSHALPFHTDAGERGGIARAIGYLEREKRHGALVFSGGTADVAPLTVRLGELAGNRGETWHLLSSGAFVTIIVPLIVFLALQRYFVRGLLAGSVKG